MFELEKVESAGAQIKVIGVGGCGCNAVNNMISAQLKGVEFLSCNTDIQTLRSSLSSGRIQIGAKLTRGLGAGGSPDIGRSAALESEKDLRATLEDTDMVFITAGMGGGTGTGASPILARIAKEAGALVVAVVTRPFHFEGKRRNSQAESGIERLREHVDALIVIPNDKLLAVSDKRTPLSEAFKMADEVLRQAVQGVTDLIFRPGMINVDFADIRTVMGSAGTAIMGIGVGRGDNRAAAAAQLAIQSPLLDVPIAGARGILFNVTASPNVGIHEVDEAATIIRTIADPDATIIWGHVINPEMEDTVQITVIATGLSLLPRTGAGKPSSPLRLSPSRAPRDPPPGESPAGKSRRSVPSPRRRICFEEAARPPLPSTRPPPSGGGGRNNPTALRPAPTRFPLLEDLPGGRELDPRSSPRGSTGLGAGFPKRLRRGSGEPGVPIRLLRPPPSGRGGGAVLPLADSGPVRRLGCPDPSLSRRDGEHLLRGGLGLLGGVAPASGDPNES